MPSSEKWSGFAGSDIRTAAQLLAGRRERRMGPPLSLSLPPVDADGGLARGTLIELSGPRSSGLFSLVLAALAAATRGGEPAALVDADGNLDPQNARAAGVDLARLLWLRPPEARLCLMGAETALAAGFALVALDLGLAAPRHAWPDAAWTRLSRAAEARRGILLVASPTPSFVPTADTRMTLDEARVLWAGEGTGPALLTGTQSRLTLRHRRGDRRERAGTMTFPLVDER